MDAVEAMKRVRVFGIEKGVVDRGNGEKVGYRKGGIEVVEVSGDFFLLGDSLNVQIMGDDVIFHKGGIGELEKAVEVLFSDEEGICIGLWLGG